MALAAVGVTLAPTAFLFSNDPAHSRPWNPPATRHLLYPADVTDAFWITFAWYVRYVAPGLPVAREHVAAGLFLLAWTIFTAYMLLASFRTNMAL